MENAGTVVLVIPLDGQDIVNADGDPSRLEVHRLNLVTGTWELLPTFLTDFAAPLRLMVTLEEFSHSIVGISQPISLRTQSESPPTLSPAGGTTSEPAPISVAENNWSGTVIIGVSAGAIGLLLAMLISVVLIRRRA